MDLVNFLEVQHNDSANPCYFTDFETDEIVYVNGAMQKKLQIFEDLIGQKCHSVIHNLDSPCHFCDKQQATSQAFTESRIFNQVFNHPQRARSAIIYVEGRKLLMTKYFISSMDKRRAVAENTFEDAMTRCIEILGETDQEASIYSFLQLLGDFYSSEITFIFEFDRNQNKVGKSFYWSGSQGKPLAPTTEEEISMVIPWIEGQHGDILELDAETSQFSSDLMGEKIFAHFQITNAVVSKLYDKNGNLIGIVGMHNCSEPVYDRRLLTAVSRFVTESFSRQIMLSTIATINDVDLLTGFFNRNMYAKRLVLLQEQPPKTLGVLFVNLNGLRKTNEYFGFDVGDEQIKKTVHLLREFFTEEFYRISGDEFVSFLPNCEKEVFDEKVNALQKKLRQSSQDATFSLGTAWDSGHFNIADLVKIADTVMIINKQEYYFNSLHDRDEIKNTVMQDVFRAIAEDEFLVYLQPQINLDSKEVVGAEALIRRFDKKNQRMIFPDNFIPLYEMNSVIRHVDLFMVRKICQMLYNWRINDQELPISVNLSRVTLTEFGIVETVSKIVDEYGVPRNLIVIEVTERVGLIENEVNANLVDEFKAAGFRLSLDDFGCAYSNIVTLAQISVDEVKIDKSLVDNLISNPKNRIIVKNMLLMCNELDNIFTLAEGIETEEQAEYLRSMHCHLGQGYLYSRPIPNEEFYEKYMYKE